MKNSIIQYREAYSVDELNALLAAHPESSLKMHWLIDGHPCFLVAIWEVNPRRLDQGAGREESQSKNSRPRRLFEWESEGEPKGKIKLSRLLGRLIAELREGRKIQISRFDTGNLNVSVTQDGNLDEGYTPGVFNDLPTPTERVAD